MTAGLRLDEQLVGAWSPTDVPDRGDLEQYLDAARSGTPLTFDLTLTSDDVEQLTSHLDTPMVATGRVIAPQLSPDPLAIADGSVQLVVADDPINPPTQHMRYHLSLPGAPGGPLELDGFKVLTKGDIGQLWSASTTLHVTIRRGGELIGRGIVEVHPEAFVRQVASMHVTGDIGEVRRLELLARFGGSFFGALWDDYGTVVHRSSRLARRAPPRSRRPLEVPARQVLAYRTDDGVDLQLTRYRGGDRGPVVLVHGMGANPLTYTTDTISQNLTEYLVANGFDVWLQEWRGSTSLPTSAGQFNADQVAQFDHPAAEAAIRDATGQHDIHWVTHCVGSMTWMMSVLGGWTTPASLVLSQVGAHPVGPTLTRLKADIRAANLLRRLGTRHLTTDSYDSESLGAKAFDVALRFYPIRPKEERCGSAVCRRLAFIYGIAVHNDAVDELTHACLHELFGITNLTMMQHLSRCALAERVVAADGTEAYMPQVTRATMPITLVHGAYNQVWLPESTQRTYDWLVAANGAAGFTRVVFDDHGHQDSFMGAQARDDAFPAVLDHLKRVGA